MSVKINPQRHHARKNTCGPTDTVSTPQDFPSKNIAACTSTPPSCLSCSRALFAGWEEGEGRMPLQRTSASPLPESSPQSEGLQEPLRKTASPLL